MKWVFWDRVLSSANDPWAVLLGEKSDETEQTCVTRVGAAVREPAPVNRKIRTFVCKPRHDLNALV